MNDDLLMTMLKEIRDDQKVIVEKVIRMERDWEISINGYAPHQVVELLHWVNEQKTKEEQRNYNIKKAIISWIVPTLLSAAMVGIFMINRI